MKNVLIDTSVLRDYLKGDKRAQRALAPYAHRSISVVTWVELMSSCPAGVLEETRSFLRTFERLSIGEAIADEALSLMQKRPGLELARALTWASANVNRIAYVTVESEHVSKADADVVIAYRQQDGDKEAR